MRSRLVRRARQLALWLETIDKRTRRAHFDSDRVSLITWSMRPDIQKSKVDMVHGEVA